MSHRADAPHDLLFGLLALQNGMINQSQLVAAFGAWTLAKDRPMSEVLLGQGALSEPRRGLLEALVAEHLAIHGGDPEKSLAVLDAGRSTRESLARLGDPEIEATLARVGSGSAASEDGDSDRTSTYAVGTATSDGQRFRILRPHARGGLGAVFVALDEELHREVALKQILDRYADDVTSRTRFVLEAEITGGLEHPGIVPVYGLGTYADGRPYYAMRFIRGDSLKEAIARFHGSEELKREPGLRSLELRKLLRRFLDICNAIEYAHTRGVLHRDIKPGNIIIGKHGETLVVDWGLAKAVGRGDPSTPADERTLTPSSASGSAETLPGSALGTPAYMSPEQAAGDLDRLGPRSDVYSLGATLYCLLTGRPPIEGDDPGAVLRQVQAGEFHPPRRLDPSIDRALEAICLKAMATRPEDRYDSPKALADEVERWMADEPVAAWREPLGRRARRWARRNRMAVTAVAGALVAGVIGLAAVLAVQTRAKADLARSLANETRANTALVAANAELTRSRSAVQNRYELAVEAIKTFHTGVSEDFLLKQDQFKDLRNRLLQDAVKFYRKLERLLTEEHTGDPRRRHELVHSLASMGHLMAQIGNAREALVEYERAATIAGALASAEPAIKHNQDEEAYLLVHIGSLLTATGKPTDAEAEYRRAMAIYKKLADDYPDDTRFPTQLGLIHSDLGKVLEQMGRMPAAETEYRQALPILQKLADDHPDDTLVRYLLAASHHRLGALLILRGQPSGAEAEHRAALTLFRKLADDQPDVTDYRNSLAFTHLTLGFLLSTLGRPSPAEAEYHQAVTTFQKLTDDYPAVTEYRRGLADGRIRLGTVLRDSGKPSEAEAEFRRAIAILQTLADDHPAVIEFHMSLAEGHMSLGLVMAQMGRPAAETEHRAALAIFQKLAEENPEFPRHRRGMTNCLNNIGDLLTDAGRVSEALEIYGRARDILEALLKAHAGVSDYRNGLAFSLSGLGRARRRAGESGEAAADLRRAVALREGLANLSPEARFDLARNHALLAGLAAEAGSGVSPAEGRAETDRAVAVLARLVAEGYRNPTASTDPDLEPLRGRSDFQLLLLDLTFPAAPFVRPR